MSALDKLKNKGVDETTSLEHAVLILFLSEETKGKPLANEAAEELAAMREAVEAASEALKLSVMLVKGSDLKADLRAVIEKLDALK